MKTFMPVVSLACITLCGSLTFAQVKVTREQILFYTSDWRGERFPDGRPKLPESLLKRALDVSIEDVWDYLREQGYRNQFDGDWQALHIDKPMAGRALTAQYMPVRPDMAKAIMAEGKREGRVGSTNSWPIAELQLGDVYVADGFGKIVEGTLIGSNLGNGIAPIPTPDLCSTPVFAIRKRTARFRTSMASIADTIRRLGRKCS